MRKKMSNQNDNRLRVLRYVGMMLVLVPLLIGAASATTWYVDGDGGGGINFTQIQEAMGAARDNDTIIVYNGSYNESLTMYKRLILKGEGHPVVGRIRISTDGCVIDGFKVTGSKDSGIYVYSDYNMIVNNSIYDNEDDGIELEGSDYNTIKNNLVFNNSDDGIDIDDSEYNTIANNNVFNNSDDGMDIEHSFNNTLINNTVCLNTDEGIKLKNSSTNSIRNNIIYTNGGAGIYLCRSWGAEPVDGGSSYNTITSNVIYSNDGEGIKLKENSSNNKIYNNNLIYNDEQAYDDGNNNSWDNGPIIGGNYWSAHKCVGNPSNGSQPYYIGRDSIDRYPFEDPIGELPPLPPPVPRTNVYVDKTEWLSTSDTYIDHNQLYNFDIGWNAGFWNVKNLDDVTITITTPIGIAYAGTWALCDNGSDTWSVLPFTHIGENYTWVIPLKDCFASSNSFYLPDKTVQSNPWADMVVNTMDEGDYTRLNVTIIPRIASVSVDLNIWGAIIDYSCPSEFGEGKFLPDSRINFYGDLDDLNQGQSYNFSILVDEPKEVELWLDKTHEGGSTKYSEILTLPVSELGSVTVSYDVPVKWRYELTQPQYTQSIRIEF